MAESFMTETPDDIDAHASALTKNGLALLNETSREAAVEALGYFDRALSLRRRLPLDANPTFRYGLAACLLNRADVLVRLGENGSLESALDGYDEAISLLRELPLGDDPR